MLQDALAVSFAFLVNEEQDSKAKGPQGFARRASSWYVSSGTFVIVDDRRTVFSADLAGNRWLRLEAGLEAMVDTKGPSMHPRSRRAKSVRTLDPTHLPLLHPNDGNPLVLANVARVRITLLYHRLPFPLMENYQDWPRPTKDVATLLLACHATSVGQGLSSAVFGSRKQARSDLVFSFLCTGRITCATPPSAL